MRNPKELVRPGKSIVSFLITTCVLASLLTFPSQVALGSFPRDDDVGDSSNIAAATPTPPDWWYDPASPQQAAPTVSDPQEQPPWWYAPSEDAEVSPQDSAAMDIAVNLPSSHAMNAGVIPLNVKITSDAPTPKLVVQVTSEDVPEKAIYVDYEKSPHGAVQTLGGFQQAQFIGGVGTDNAAEITFQYEALKQGWINFTVQVKSKKNTIYSQVHSIYINPVAPTFTNADVTVDLPSSHPMNSAIPLSVQIAADGKTPKLVVQVTSEDVPGKAIYVDYEKTPGGAVQTLGNFQQAQFIGGVGADNTAGITFEYEALEAGWLNFTVQVWSGNTSLYEQAHSVHVNKVIPTFNNMDISTIANWSSRGLNAGAIPLGVRITADGKTPELTVQVTSEDVPGKADYVDYEKVPHGAVQTLSGFQQARFMGGVGASNTAVITFTYEPVEVGWIHFTVQVKSKGNILYGPEDHWIYIRETGTLITSYPPYVKDFSIASQEDERVTFNLDVLGDPDPQYEFTCDSGGAVAERDGMTCVYPHEGKFYARLTASNTVEGIDYTEISTIPVYVFEHFVYLPLVTQEQNPASR